MAGKTAQKFDKIIDDLEYAELERTSLGVSLVTLKYSVSKLKDASVEKKVAKLGKYDESALKKCKDGLLNMYKETIKAYDVVSKQLDNFNKEMKGVSEIRDLSQKKITKYEGAFKQAEALMKKDPEKAAKSLTESLKKEGLSLTVSCS